jgi:hypothetical protein
VTRSGPWKIAILFLLMFLAVYAMAYVQQRMGRAQEPGSPTTYSSGMLGYKILYLWLKDLGIPVERWEKDLKNLPPQAAVLVLLEPRLDPEPGEILALEGWVRRGGTLFVASRMPSSFLTSFGLSLARYKGEDGMKEPGFQPGPYIRGKRDVRSDGHPDLASSRADLVVHVRDKWGALIGVLEKGKGRVIVLTDPGLISNLNLKQGDHARLALEFLLSHLGQGTLLVDEYHHGYGRATSVIGHVLGSGVQGLLLQGGLILLVLWAVAGRRFGPPRPLPKEEGRSPMEYVRAMAGLFQRARANRLALETVSRWIEEEAKRLLIDKDRGLQEKLKQSKERYQTDAVTEQALLLQARDLYLAFENAKRRAPGG